MNDETEKEGKGSSAQDATKPVQLNDEALDSVAGGTKGQQSEGHYLKFTFKQVAVKTVS